ncbi:MAG: threonine/serine exporter family protein [Oscillospiraceae bacterium]|nr:threonine/serine exporter family protein [Oscillospiraceae bacterium]
MDYYQLLELCSDLGYQLAMSGAETFRIEDTIHRIMAAYGIESEVFAIPNNLLISIIGANGKPMTRMRRIGFHGNNMDAVEQYNALSRKICAEIPDPAIATEWLRTTKASIRSYKPLWMTLGSMIAAAGYAVFFGGDWTDFLSAMVCGFLIGVVTHYMNKMKVNPFFSTILLSLVVALTAYSMCQFQLTYSADCVIIGTLMILLPGLVFTNAVRDIIYGDTNSGVNRIIQVLLIAAAIALGTGIGLKITETFAGSTISHAPIKYPLWIQCIAAAFGCVGFLALFNVHGKGTVLCVLGGGLTWAIYGLTIMCGGSDFTGYFIATIFAAAYAEIMARIRKCPALGYLVISIFPLLPGAGIYYTTNYFIRGDMSAFSREVTSTIAIAGALAVGILIISTLFRLISVLQQNKK